MVKKIQKRKKSFFSKKNAYVIVPLILLPVAALAFYLTTAFIQMRSRAASEATFPPISERDQNGNYAKGEILIKFKEGVDENDSKKTLNRHGARVMEELPQTKIKRIKVNDHALPHVLEALQNNPRVDFAEVNTISTPLIVPNDPWWSSSWHHPKISTDLAWNSAKATGILTAVCDTGVDGSHQDLQPILRTDLGWNSDDNSNNWSPIAGHGTMVTGSLAAVANNGIGVAGVAWGANVIPVRITNYPDGSAAASAASKCITYAADNGAKVINLSYDFSGSAAVDASAQYAQSKGALTFVAAGNSATDWARPNYPGFITLSATTSTDSLASFSNYGNNVDLSAPGQNILTTVSPNTYGAVSGTSFATPVTAGVAALIFGANPSLSPAQVQQILIQSATDLGPSGYDTYFGWGRVNASRAVSQALGAEIDTTPPTGSISSPANYATVFGTVPISVTASDNIAVKSVNLYINDNYTFTDSTSPYSFSWNTLNLTNGSYTLKLKIYDSNDNTYDSNPISVNVNNSPDTTPPAITMTAPVSGETVSGSQVRISAQGASDDRGVTSVDFNVDGIVINTLNGCGSCGIYWDSTKFANGQHSVWVTAYDLAGNAGNSATATVTVANTPDSTAPTVSLTAPTTGSTLNGFPTVSATATDNDRVTKVVFLYNGNYYIGEDTTAPYTATWNTTITPNGTYQITAKAYDPAGNVGVSSAISVIINNASAPTPTSVATPTPTRTPTPVPNDTISPTVTISSPLNGARVSGNITIKANATDNISVSRMEVLIDGQLKTSAGGSSISTKWNVGSKGVASGNHAITVKAYDAAGNIGTNTITVTK